MRKRYVLFCSELRIKAQLAVREVGVQYFDSYEVINENYYFSKVDEYGFERPDDFDYETYEDFMSQYLIVLARRAKKWAELIGEGKSLKRNLTVKKYVRKGIPGEYRGRVSTRCGKRCQISFRG
jgi:hypothetical protein